MPPVQSSPDLGGMHSLGPIGKRQVAGAERLYEVRSCERPKCNCRCDSLTKGNVDPRRLADELSHTATGEIGERAKIRFDDPPGSF